MGGKLLAEPNGSNSNEKMPIDFGNGKFLFIFYRIWIWNGLELTYYSVDVKKTIHFFVQYQQLNQSNLIKNN